MKLEIKGHSGCQVDIVNENGQVFVYKSTHKQSYFNRLKLQGQKQMTASEVCIPNIRVPEILDIEVDGVKVKAKGLTHKIGETATIETNMVELTKDWIKSTVIGAEGTSEDARFNVIESKPHIEESDYIQNLAYVGFMTDGTPIIIVFDYALCTSGLEAEGKNKENSVFPATFECYADLAEGATDTLPYHIYTAVATA